MTVQTKKKTIEKKLRTGKKRGLVTLRGDVKVREMGARGGGEIKAVLWKETGNLPRGIWFPREGKTLFHQEMERP